MRLKDNKLFSKLKENTFFNVISHFKNYFGANIAIKALGIISLPVLTRLLTPEDYGVISVFNSWTKIFIILFTMNTHVAVGRYFYEGKDDFKEFVGTTTILSITCTCLFGLAFVLFQKKFSALLELPIELILFIPPIIFNKVSYSIFNQIHLCLRHSKKLAKVKIANHYLTFFLAVIIILMITEKKYLGQIVAVLIIETLFSIYFFTQLKSYFKWAFKSEGLKYILSYSVPLIPYHLSGIILVQIDRIIINSYSGQAATGLYSFAYNIGMLLAVFTSALYNAWMPDYYAYMNKEKYDKHDSDVSKIFRMIMVASIILILFGKETGIILGAKNFHESLDIVPIVVLGYIFFAAFYIYGGRNLTYAKKLATCHLLF